MKNAPKVAATPPQIITTVLTADIKIIKANTIERGIQKAGYLHIFSKPLQLALNVHCGGKSGSAK